MQQISQFSLIYQFHKLGREPKYRKERALYFALRHRVIRLSARIFLVESKRYLQTLGIPSVYHTVVLTKPPSELYMMCDCKFWALHGSVFNCCSHVLSVLFALSLKAMSPILLLERDALMNQSEDFASKVCLKRDRIEGSFCYMCKRKVTLNRVNLVSDLRYECNNCGHVFNEQQLNKLIVFNQTYEKIPLVGNEYMDHVKAKKRIHDLLSKTDGFRHVEYEHSVQCRNPITGVANKYPYSLDVYAEYRPKDQSGIIMIGIEVHGVKGHGTPITIPQDENRAQEIEEQHNIKVIQFYIKSQMENVSDSYILEEIFEKIGV